MFVPDFTSTVGSSMTWKNVALLMGTEFIVSTLLIELRYGSLYFWRPSHSSIKCCGVSTLSGFLQHGQGWFFVLDV